MHKNQRIYGGVGMNMSVFFLLLSAVVFAIGFYEMRKIHANAFGVGLFLVVLQYVVLPWVVVFISWFVKIGADGTVPVATYLQGLFIVSIILGIYWLGKLWSSYMKKGV